LRVISVPVVIGLVRLPGPGIEVDQFARRLAARTAPLRLG
jgi:hypothetical protein